MHWTVWACVVSSALNLIGYVALKDKRQQEQRSAFMAIFFLVLACFLILAGVT